MLAAHGPSLHHPALGGPEHVDLIAARLVRDGRGAVHVSATQALGGRYRRGVLRDQVDGVVHADGDHPQGTRTGSDRGRGAEVAARSQHRPRRPPSRGVAAVPEAVVGADGEHVVAPGAVDDGGTAERSGHPGDVREPAGRGLAQHARATVAERAGKTQLPRARGGRHGQPPGRGGHCGGHGSGGDGPGHRPRSSHRPGGGADRGRGRGRRVGRRVSRRRSQRPGAAKTSVDAGGASRSFPAGTGHVTYTRAGRLVVRRPGVSPDLSAGPVSPNDHDEASQWGHLPRPAVRLLTRCPSMSESQPVTRAMARILFTASSAATL